jgi:hypothetical protein
MLVYEGLSVSLLANQEAECLLADQSVRTEASRLLPESRIRQYYIKDEMAVLQPG